MIKLYRYSGKQIKETEAEKETANFWIINGRREAKVLREYPNQIWHRTPEEAVQAVIDYMFTQMNTFLARANQYQDKLDEASGFLIGLERAKEED